MKRKVDTIFIHCSASDASAHDDVAVINRWHKDRGWSGVGYHFFIQSSGAIQFGRDTEKTPAAQKGHNTGSLAICLSGNLEFTEKQFVSLRRLCLWLQKEVGAPLYIRAHNEVSTKSCPNFNIHARIPLDKAGYVLS